ncbi:hypothetical protein [Bradyrhizobium sp. CB3481]|uniref:hypothetical protein n=1 Tax=Bradyrhizobium sp. CB3481 TaxID=3039158 RepID=UPI0024B0E76C|nr:hypothetical protein [Bradyrhizobium sp. CB3481]WFU16720.1 hypothetical protein QA643_38290 [Bradyrhizobium sp. CB3481]
MSKARLHLIRCASDIEPQARVRRRECSFQLTVIDGGRRPGRAELADPWEALLDVFGKALLIAEANYAAILAASLTTLELYPRHFSKARTDMREIGNSHVTHDGG